MVKKETPVRKSPRNRPSVTYDEWEGLEHEKGFQGVSCGLKVEGVPGGRKATRNVGEKKKRTREKNKGEDESRAVRRVKFNELQKTKGGKGPKKKAKQNETGKKVDARVKSRGARGTAARIGADEDTEMSEQKAGDEGRKMRKRGKPLGNERSVRQKRGLLSLSDSGETSSTKPPSTDEVVVLDMSENENAGAGKNETVSTYAIDKPSPTEGTPLTAPSRLESEDGGGPSSTPGSVMDFKAFIDSAMDSNNKQRKDLLNKIMVQAEKTDKVVQSMEEIAQFWKKESVKQSKLTVGQQGASALLKEVQGKLQSLQDDFEKKVYQEVSEKLMAAQGAQGPCAEVHNASVQTEEVEYERVDIEEEGKRQDATQEKESAAAIPEESPDSPSLMEGSAGRLPYSIFGKPGKDMAINESVRPIAVDSQGAEQEDEGKADAVNTKTAEVQDCNPDGTPASLSTSISLSGLATEDTSGKDKDQDIDQLVALHGEKLACNVMARLKVYGFTMRGDEEELVLSHKPTHFSFSITDANEYETEFDDCAKIDEVDKGVLRYTPIKLGLLGPHLPEYLQVGLIFLQCDGVKFLHNLADAFVELICRNKD